VIKSSPAVDPALAWGIKKPGLINPALNFCTNILANYIKVHIILIFNFYRNLFIWTKNILFFTTTKFYRIPIIVFYIKLQINLFL